MKVLLLNNVRSLGKKDEIVTVPDGYANNNLIPRGLAIPANSPKAKQKAQKTKEHQAKAALGQEKTKLALQEISKVTIAGKTNEQGSLYKSISAQDISKHLKKIHHVDVPASKITLPDAHHLKTLGAYPFTIQIGKETLPLTLQIIAE